MAALVHSHQEEGMVINAAPVVQEDQEAASLGGNDPGDEGGWAFEPIPFEENPNSHPSSAPGLFDLDLNDLLDFELNEDSSKNLN